jgi:hypothetical protein
MLEPGDRKYLWLAMVIPFGMFFTDQPGIRQLSVLWIPFGITAAAVFSKLRWSGAAVSALCVLALVPYYGMKTFPYHRSNWREAVAAVESEAQPDDIVVVFGGKSTSLAWEYYSETDMDYLAPSGNLPFAPDRERIRVYPEQLIDSLFEEGGHQQVWVVLDVWETPSIQSIRGCYSFEFYRRISERMEVALLRDEHAQ